MVAGRHQSHGAAAQRAGQTVPERGQRRGERQAGGNAGDDHADGTLAERRAHRRQRDDHERELAALGEQKAELDRAGVDQPKARAASATRNALSAINGEEHQDLRPIGEEIAPVERHADGDEEEAEQQVAKRPRLGLDHVAIGVSEMIMPPKNAPSEGQAGAAGRGCRRQDDQERGCGEDLLLARLREETEQRLDRIAPISTAARNATTALSAADDTAIARPTRPAPRRRLRARPRESGERWRRCPER